MKKNGWVPTVCYQCKAECAILVLLKDSMIKEIRGNPKHGGKVCVKGMAGISLQYNPDRIKYPLKRIGERGENKFERITWNEALNTITKKLSNLKEKKLEDKVTFDFFPHSFTDPKWRFIKAYGGFINTALPHCDSAKITAFLNAVGGVPIHHVPPAWFTVPKGGIMIMLGRNAMECLDNADIPKDILDAQERGAKLVVLDPLYTTEASKADLWIPIKPASDNAFLIGMINHIIVKKLYDKDFTDNWIKDGDFDKLSKYIIDKTPEKMSKICGVDSKIIIELAEECAKAPSVGIDSFKGIMLGQAMDVGHAWMILLAITGNFDNPGGQALPDVTPIPALEPIPKEPDLHKYGWHRTGEDKEKFKNYSFIMEPTWYQAKAIRNDDLKALLVAEANPAKTTMGEVEWQKAVTEKDKGGNYKLELLVVHDIFLTETAKYADIILPDKSYFERWEMLYMPWMYHYGHEIMLREPIVEPLGECRHTNEIYIELGKRLTPEYFKVKDVKDYYNQQLSSLGLSIKKLQEIGNIWSTTSIGFRKYEENGFDTPSGKVEIYWDQYENVNRALPSSDIAPEYKVDVDKYPFILISYRTIFHQGTGMWSHNNPQLRDSVSGVSYNPALINPIAAEKLDIKDGDIVIIKSNWGEVKIPASITERIRPDCIGLMHGFGGKQGRITPQSCGVSDNLLIPDAGSTLDYQDLIGGESHVSCRVNITKEES